MSNLSKPTKQVKSQTTQAQQGKDVMLDASHDGHRGGVAAGTVYLANFKQGFMETIGDGMGELSDSLRESTVTFEDNVLVEVEQVMGKPLAELPGSGTRKVTTLSLCQPRQQAALSPAKSS